MQDLVSYESYPTHPLGARDSWPSTGPIYHIPTPETPAEPTRTFWQRLTTNATVASTRDETVPGSLPIWY